MKTINVPQMNLATNKQIYQAIKPGWISQLLCKLGFSKDYSNLLRAAYHPTEPLVSICYSPYTNCLPPTHDDWDKITLSCRGIILNTKTKEIVAKPFNKFFNYDPSLTGLDIESSSYILEKLDGSLGVSYFQPSDGKIAMASKNSFTSDMAQFGTKWIRGLKDVRFNPELTYVWEIIYPENRIVIDYSGRTECVLIGIIRTSTGVEMDWDVVESFANTNNISIPKRFAFDSFQEAVKKAETLPWSEEGYVVNINLPLLHNRKYKIKGEQYRTVHDVLTNTGTRTIWKMIRDHIDFPVILQRIPEEVRQEKLAIYNTMLQEKKDIEVKAKSIFDNIYKPNMSRKDFAIEAIKHKPYVSILFLFLDGYTNDIDKVTTKMIEEKYKQKWISEELS